ncbi:divalent metal cation transporter [Nocardioides convexus]|uniref:divalent metal cation transporter n=1 Tax=Nocardioides convexus TaxID=2712224 RepID=UPI0024186241|nr:divalent metal cation transporter [Nocardioides convexus]
MQDARADAVAGRYDDPGLRRQPDRPRRPAGERGRPVKRYLAVLLGVLTAIGGFVDIGDLVTNAQVGARFGLGMVWVVVVGVVGICLFAEMSGRIAAVSHRATFDLVRERLGPRMGLLNLVGSMLVTLLTFIAEIGGVALALQAGQAR